MAKSRAQGKAEQRKKRQQALEERARKQQAKAQHDTQVPESGEVAEVEAALEAGAEEASQLEPEAPAPSRADIGSGEDAGAGGDGEGTMTRRERRRLQKEQERRARESAERRAPKEVKVERERGRVAAFFASVIAELRKVQWPDRDTLVQASTVTLIFVAIAAAYLGVLDAIFGWVVDQLIT